MLTRKACYVDLIIQIPLQATLTQHCMHHRAEYYKAAFYSIIWCIYVGSFMHARGLKLSSSVIFDNLEFTIPSIMECLVPWLRVLFEQCTGDTKKFAALLNVQVKQLPDRPCTCASCRETGTNITTPKLLLQS